MCWVVVSADIADRAVVVIVVVVNVVVVVVVALHLNRRAEILIILICTDSQEAFLRTTFKRKAARISHRFTAI